MTTPKKKFGQNFITDKNLLSKIVSLAMIKQENVLEIGPGRGALTSFIANEAKKVLCYEIDRDLKEYLDPLETEYGNLKIIYNDYLSSNEEEITKYFMDEKATLVSNVPYYITSPIIFSFLKNELIDKAVLMMQKEVAQRILAKPKNKEYGSLSVSIQAFCKVEKLLNVSRKMFYPIPDVDSIVISIKKKEQINLDFIEFVRNIFNQKRKTLYNNLVNVVGLSPDISLSLLIKAKIDRNIRSEEIDIETIKKIYMLWKEL